ncbi:MAG: hypothetical protein HQL43_15280 [Alphaproteobacteria bacterium]|nr:hypothetical protein [Alphaproteobacteria bacterium]
MRTTAKANPAEDQRQIRIRSDMACSFLQSRVGKGFSPKAISFQFGIAQRQADRRPQLRNRVAKSVGHSPIDMNDACVVGCIILFVTILARGGVFMAFVPKEKQEKGVRAEKAFLNWLNLKGYPYIYLDQSVERFPAKLSGLFKRPDFIVFLFRLGAFFVDVKGYKIYQDQQGGRYFSLSSQETTSYGHFETLTSMPVWLACVPDEEGYQAAYLFPISLVLSCDEQKFKGIDFFKIPLDSQLVKRIPLDEAGSFSTICEFEYA